MLGDFYTIRSLSEEADTVNAVVEINAAHKIFAGHFPGQPVVPGVCMLQLVKEITEQQLGYQLLLQRADDMKFLAVIDPVVNNLINVTIKYAVEEDGAVKVVASMFKTDLVHFKFKGSFQQEAVAIN